MTRRLPPRARRRQKLLARAARAGAEVPASEPQRSIVVSAAVEGVEVSSRPQDYSGASSDAGLVELWLHGRSPHTVLAYRADVRLFFGFLESRGRSLHTATLRDLQDWGAGLEGKQRTLVRRLSSVKSLLSFGLKTGYLRVNVGAAFELPSVPNELAQRILTEEQVHALINAAAPGRDRTVVRFLYSSAARATEACQLSWLHLQRGHDEQGLVTLHGKGGKTRHVLFSKAVMDDLTSLRGDGADDHGYVFLHRGGRLTQRELGRIVSGAAKLAGIDANVSPHWLRHAHASHALDRGAPIHLVQATLGHASVATTGRYTHARPKDGSSRFLSV